VIGQTIPGGLQLIVTAVGQVKLGTGATLSVPPDSVVVDVLAILEYLVAKLQVATVLTPTGPQPLQDAGIAWATAPGVLLARTAIALIKGA
jgi:hypothetical protein